MWLLKFFLTFSVEFSNFDKRFFKLKTLRKFLKTLKNIINVARIKKRKKRFFISMVRGEPPHPGACNFVANP